MSGAGVVVESHLDGLEQLGQAFARHVALGGDPRDLWDAVGQYGETSTRLRFKNQVGPDGQAWKPSRRAQRTGGQTLVRKGRLLRSFSHHTTGAGTEWGTNVIYAAIHQFGGTIQKKASSGVLRLRTGKGGALLRQRDHQHLAVFARASHKKAVERSYTVGAHTITMPARPSLGVNAADGREILALCVDALDQVDGHGGVH